MTLVKKKEYEEVCLYVAQRVAAVIRNQPNALITLAAGDTMLGVFDALLQMQERGEVDLCAAHYVSLDEWGGIGYETAGSCKQVLYDHFFTPAGIPEDRICFFDGLNPRANEECNRVAKYINTHGPLAIAVLGIGMNGHVGFNEPYTRTDGVCLPVRLDPTTRTVSSKYFGEMTTCDYGITLSMDTLLKSQEVILVANGAKKAAIVYKTLHDMPSMAVPSSMLRNHKNSTLVVDAAAV